MSTKKAPQAHPAQLAAESDLIKLTREFESLSAQLVELDDQGEALEDDDKAARINYDMGIKHRQKRRESIARSRRVLNAQLQNCQDLLNAVLQAKHNQLLGFGCGRLSATECRDLSNTILGR